MRPHLVALLAGLAVVAAGCSGGSGSSLGSLTTPTSTTEVTTETFSGTVPVGGSDAHSFNVMTPNGALTVTLTAAGPPPTIYMGLGLGTPSGDTCTPIASTGAAVLAQAGTSAQLVGTAGTGAFCVAVFDVGNQTVDVTYSVTVTHY